MLEKSASLILDASAAAKWFINEPDSQKMDSLLSEVAQGRWQLMAPELLRCELAQIFWKHRDSGYTWQQARLAYQELEHLGLIEVPIGPLFPKAIEIAYQCQISVYDATYATLAQSSRATLVTFDQEFLKKIRRHTRIPIYTFS